MCLWWELLRAQGPAGTHAGHVISIQLLDGSSNPVPGYSVSPNPITIDASGNYSGTITYNGSMTGLTVKATCSYQGSSMSTEAAVSSDSSG